MELHSEYPEIVAELEAMRPRPRPDFAAELDARVAAGFSDSTRREAPGSTGSGRGSATSPGAAWRALSERSHWSRSPSRRPRSRSPNPVRRRARGNSSITPRHPREIAPSPAPQRLGRQPQRVQPEGPAGGRLLGATGVGRGTPGRRQSGPYAARARARDIERSARVTLAVDPDDVRSAASEVFSTVHAYDGIVLRSSVHSRREGDAVASFDLLIPSARLDDALAAFSDIGPVSSRSDASVDVTAPTVGLEERVAGLAGEDQEPPRRARRAQTPMSSGNRWKQSCARSAIGSPGFGPGSTPCSVAPTSPGSRCGSSRTRTARGAGSWGIGDALADAARILGIAAGVTLIGLAVLAPIALIALLLWAAQRAWVRRSRERVLD